MKPYDYENLAAQVQAAMNIGQLALLLTTIAIVVVTVRYMRKAY